MVRKPSQFGPPIRPDTISLPTGGATPTAGRFEFRRDSGPAKGVPTNAYPVLFTNLTGVSIKLLLNRNVNASNTNFDLIIPDGTIQELSIVGLVGVRLVSFITDVNPTGIVLGEHWDIKGWIEGQYT